MAIQTRGTFVELYDNIDKDIFTLLFDSNKELANIWRKVINVMTSKRKFERVMSVTGVGDIPEKGEGAPYTAQVIRPGWTKDFIHTEFGAMFEVTQTALEDDQYDQLAQNARWFMFASRVVEEKRAAILYNNGFTTEQSPDGVSIFNSAHVLKGGGTARNVPAANADLSATSLEQALIDVQTQTKVEAGQLVAPATSLLLHVPPALEFQAHRLINSQLRPGVADNDVNALKERKWSVVVNPYLTDDDAWFLQDANKKNIGLRSYTRVGLSMEPAMTDPRTRNRMYPVRWRRSFGCAFWQGVYASQGA
jgi:hypothetical protein